MQFIRPLLKIKEPGLLFEWVQHFKNRVEPIPHHKKPGEPEKPYE